MLVEIPPKIAVSSFMGYLKGKSSTMLYEQFGELKYKYRNRARLRAASNNPYAVGGPYSRVYAFARNKGLCPHLKYHAFHAWMFINAIKVCRQGL